MGQVRKKKEVDSFFGHTGAIDRIYECESAIILTFGWKFLDLYVYFKLGKKRTQNLAKNSALLLFIDCTICMQR